MAQPQLVGQSLQLFEGGVQKIQKPSGERGSGSDVTDRPQKSAGIYFNT